MLWEIVAFDLPFFNGTFRPPRYGFAVSVKVADTAVSVTLMVSEAIRLLVVSVPEITDEPTDTPVTRPELGSTVATVEVAELKVTGPAAGSLSPVPLGPLHSCQLA